MKTFKQHLEELAYGLPNPKVNHSYHCQHCDCQMDIEREKYKHSRLPLENSGLGVVIGKDAFCKKCIKNALQKEGVEDVFLDRININEKLNLDKIETSFLFNLLRRSEVSNIAKGGDINTIQGIIKKLINA